MILSIETHLDITGDMLRDIATQIDEGARLGKVPHTWMIFSKDMKETEDKVYDIDSKLSEIYDAVDQARDDFDKKLSDILESVGDIQEDHEVVSSLFD